MGERARTGVPVCAECHYELGGLMEAAPSGRCPECGEPWKRSAPFVLQPRPNLLRLALSGSWLAIIGTPVVLVLMWLASQAGMKNVVLGVGAMGGLVVVAGAVIGPLIVFVLARDEQPDAGLSTVTVVGVTLGTLAMNAVCVGVGIVLGTGMLGWRG